MSSRNKTFLEFPESRSPSTKLSIQSLTKDLGLSKASKDSKVILSQCSWYRSKGLNAQLSDWRKCIRFSVVLIPQMFGTSTSNSAISYRQSHSDVIPTCSSIFGMNCALGSFFRCRSRFKDGVRSLLVSCWFVSELLFPSRFSFTYAAVRRLALYWRRLKGEAFLNSQSLCVIRTNTVSCTFT